MSPFEKKYSNIKFH